MSFSTAALAEEPPRSEVDAWPGLVVIEFGAAWCGICRAAQPAIRQALEAFAARAEIRHVKIEDGSGRPLGRSFRVKLWPTLVLLRDGREVGRLVRPGDARQIEQALQGLQAAG